MGKKLSQSLKKILILGLSFNMAFDGSFILGIAQQKESYVDSERHQEDLETELEIKIDEETDVREINPPEIELDLDTGELDQLEDEVEESEVEKPQQTEVEMENSDLLESNFEPSEQEVDDKQYVSTERVVTVNTADELVTAIHEAPVTGEAVMIHIDQHITLGNPLRVETGKNITLKSSPDSNVVYTLYNTHSNRHIFVTRGGNLTLENIVIDGQHVFGGIEVSYENAQLTINDGTVIRNNQASNGGGIYINQTGKVMMNGGEVTGNHASSNGGGINIANNGEFIMNGGRINNNTANLGGGIYQNAMTTLYTGEINGNVATRHGGGIFIASNGSMGIVNAEIINNQAINDQGGGIYHAGRMLEIQHAIINGNTAGSVGGGISMTSNTSVQIVDAEIINNVANTNGGGINNAGNILEIQNAIISGNTAGSEGGGISLSSSASLHMHAGEITNNQAQDGGGIGAANDAIRRRITTSQGVRFDGNRARMIRVQTNANFPNIQFETLSVITNPLNPINHYDIQSSSGTEITSFYEVLIRYVDMNGNYISSQATRTYYINSGTGFNLLANLAIFPGYEPQYYLIDGNPEQHSITDAEIPVTGDMIITIYHTQSGTVDPNPNDMHTVTIQHVRFQDDEVMETTSITMETGSTFHAKDHIKTFDTYRPQHYTLDGTQFNLDETNVITQDVEIRIYYLSTLISISLPENMMFYATETTGGNVTSVQYEVKNNSDIPVNMSLTAVNLGEMQGVNLVATANEVNDLQLNLEVDLYENHHSVNLNPTIMGISLGELAANQRGAMNFSGQFFGNIPRSPLRPQFQLIFSFEAVN